MNVILCFVVVWWITLLDVLMINVWWWGGVIIYMMKKKVKRIIFFIFDLEMWYHMFVRIVMKNILKFVEDDDYIEIRRESKILNSHFLLIFREIRYVFGVRWLLFPMQEIFDLRNILDFIWKFRRKSFFYWNIKCRIWNLQFWGKLKKQN